MSRFDGKVAIITGAASGIGKEIALRFAAAGGTPVIADLNLDAADATAREIQAKDCDAFAVGMNVADEAAVEKGVADTMAKYGRIDVLVSNAVSEAHVPREIRQHHLYGVGPLQGGLRFEGALCHR